MIIFYFLFSILFIFSLLQIYDIKSKDLKFFYRSLLIILAFILIVIAGFNTTSNDYIEYMEIIKQSSNSPISEFHNIHGDFLFKLISSFVYGNTGSFSITFISFSMISVLSVFYIITKDSKLIFLSILIYFSHGFLNKEMIQLRAGLASAILLIGISLQAHGKNKTAFLYLVISGFFHSSAFIAFIPFLFNCFVKVNYIKRISLFLLLFSFCFYLLNMPDYFIQYLSLKGLLPDSVNNYVGWNLYNYDIGLSNPNTIKQIIIIILALYYFSYDKTFTTYYSYFLIGVCWLISFSSFAIIAARISSIMTISELILVPMIVKNSVQYRNIIGLFLIILYSVMFIMSIYFRNITNGLNLGIF